MKKIILILFVLLVTGCTTNYNLEISENSFKESIDIKINKNEILTEPDPEGIEVDDPITPFLSSKDPVFFTNSNIYYNKIVQDLGEYYIVNMNYEYNPADFKNSNSLNMCFDNFKFNDEKNYYIHAYGTFYCLYSDNMTINIKTNNKVLKNNADSVDGNVYTWKIDNNNKNNVDIEFEVTKKVSYTDIFITILLAVIIISLIGFVIYILKNKKRSNEI